MGSQSAAENPVGCVGNTILTWRGKTFDYSNPDPLMIEIDDIAKGLANCCRFAGQVDFYSVAEHSILCAALAMERYPADFEFAMFALMHDAAEAYVGDMPKPLKMMLPGFAEVEHAVESAIFEKFKIDSSRTQDVKAIDVAMLKAERVYIQDTLHGDLVGFDDVEDVQVRFKRLDPLVARRSFLSLFEYLDESRASG